VVFLLDEIRSSTGGELEALIAALHQVSQHELPLTLAGAGLPQLPALTGTAKSYAERLFRFPTIDRLEEQAARDALELPAREGKARRERPSDRACTPAREQTSSCAELERHKTRIRGSQERRSRSGSRRSTS
jgi:hypothetical protein